MFLLTFVNTSLHQNTQIHAVEMDSTVDTGSDYHLYIEILLFLSQKNESEVAMSMFLVSEVSFHNMLY